MFVVIFEVWPKADRWDDYLDIARQLKPEVEAIEGFIDNERFQNEQDPSGILSLSTWHDEKALIRWRTHAMHHELGQIPGRFEIFTDYRLRVGEVTVDTHLPAGEDLRQTRFDETIVGAAKAVTIIETHRPDTDIPARRHTDQPLAEQRFTSIYQPGKRLLLTSWRTAPAAELDQEWPADVRYRQVRIIREYGRRDRREAPQYFADVN